VIGGTLRVFWQGDTGSRVVKLDVKSRVDALMIALAIYKRNAAFAAVFPRLHGEIMKAAKRVKKFVDYRAFNDRDGSEVYSGTSEIDASKAARKAAEDNAQRQAIAPSPGSVWKDGKRVFYYECDPTVGRMKARKIHLTRPGRTGKPGQTPVIVG